MESTFLLNRTLTVPTFHYPSSLLCKWVYRSRKSTMMTRRKKANSRTSVPLFSEVNKLLMLSLRPFGNSFVDHNSSFNFNHLFSYSCTSPFLQMHLLEYFHQILTQLQCHQPLRSDISFVKLYMFWHRISTFKFDPRSRRVSPFLSFSTEATDFRLTHVSIMIVNEARISDFHRITTRLSIPWIGKISIKM